MDQDIAQQVAALRNAAKSKPLRKPLLQERSRLEKRIFTIEQKPLARRADYEEERLQLVRELRALDHQLDGLEEDPVEARARLIPLLLAHLPEAKKSYQELKEAQHALEEKSEKLESVKESIELLLKEMNTALSAHEGRFNLRGWLFGRTPRSMATHHINNAALMAKYLLDSLSPEETLPLFVEIREAAELLWEKQNTRWSRKGFSALFSPLREHFSLLLRAVEQEAANNDRRKEEEEAKIDEWIERTAKNLSIPGS